MSKEAASKFVQAILDDEELREKTANMKPEEAAAFAKEMGYDFTAEELAEEVNEDKELDPEELKNAVGGTLEPFYEYYSKHELQALEYTYCNYEEMITDFLFAVPRRHQFVLTGHFEEDSFLWTTNGYDVYTCNLCNFRKKVRV